MTHFGYVKRIPTAEYKTQRRGGKGVTAHKTKEEDFVVNMFVCNTHDDLLFFTSKGKVYNTVIPRNVRLGEAPSHGLPIHLYDGRSLGAQSYQQLAQEYLGRA